MYPAFPMLLSKLVDVLTETEQTNDIQSILELINEGLRVMNTQTEKEKTTKLKNTPQFCYSETILRVK